MSSRGGGGGMQPGYTNGGFQGDLNPEDLFNMFFGGGNGGFRGGQANGKSQIGSSSNSTDSVVVFTFGGPAGFQAQYRRPRTNAQPETPASPFVALLPLFILVLFALISVLPTLISGPGIPDPEFAYQRSTKLDSQRNTWQRGVPYWVNRNEWENSPIWQSVPEERRHQSDASMYSQKVRVFERNVETTYIHNLQNEASLLPCSLSSLLRWRWECEQVNGLN